MAAMNATCSTLSLLDERAKNCITQASTLRQNIVLPHMLLYNPEAGGLVTSVQSELAELEEAFKQLHKSAVNRYTHLSTVEVIVSFLFFISMQIFINVFLVVFFP